jgi:hypothetical protein
MFAIENSFGTEMELRKCDRAFCAGTKTIQLGFLYKSRVLRGEFKTVVAPLTMKSGTVPFLKALVPCAIAPVVVSKPWQERSAWMPIQLLDWFGEAPPGNAPLVEAPAGPLSMTVNSPDGPQIC